MEKSNLFLNFIILCCFIIPLDVLSIAISRATFEDTVRFYLVWRIDQKVFSICTLNPVVGWPTVSHPSTWNQKLTPGNFSHSEPKGRTDSCPEDAFVFLSLIP